MKCQEINIRDPFVLYENGMYYLYGTRAKNFGMQVGGVDVYLSSDLEEWSEPIECMNSAVHGLNRGANWAPEVHRYNGAYYMFVTFTMETGLRGTCILKSETPMGPFVPHSEGAVTPKEWECLDGTLYISAEGKPYLVFCHEHTQIIDGTICYAQMSDDLTHTVGEIETLFCASSPEWADKLPEGYHYVTDGPFMFKTKENCLLMLWSTFVKGKYAECIVRFNDGELSTNFEHLEPMIADDGGHGMIFKKGEELMLTFHTPNISGQEHPAFMTLKDFGTYLELAE